MSLDIFQTREYEKATPYGQAISTATGYEPKAP